MGNFMPTFLAFLLNSCGIYIFEDASKGGCEPLISSLIFLFGTFLLLWELRIFPACLRALWNSGAILFQFFMSAFIMEHAMNNFWFPLEDSLFSFLPRLAEYEAQLLRQVGWNSAGFFHLLKCHLIQVLASYGLSTFFLICVLHCTRMIDLGLLRCGKTIFLEDVAHRIRKYLRRAYRRLAKRRCACYTEQRCPEYSDCEEEYNGEYSGDAKPRRRRSR